MAFHPAWICSPLPTVQFRPFQPNPRYCAPSHSKLVSTPRRPRYRPLCTAAPPTPPTPPSTSDDPRGINGTTPFYFALVAAQSLPFIFPHSGVLGDFTYFITTAVAAVIIGCRRAPLEPVTLSSSISKTQAFTAPFLASAFLFGSYLLLKYTDLDVGLVFNALTTFAGSLCLKESLDPVWHSLLTLVGLEDAVLWQQNKSDTVESQNITQITLGSVLATVTALATTAAYLLHVPPTFVFSNVIAIGICARVLSLVRPDSFLVATGLLFGLFFYDIFWVFGSEVMVSVATQIDSPGKLLFPREAIGAVQSSTDYPYAILGLGDVCIPGVFVTMAQAMDRVLGSGKEPYFWAAVVAYGAGLLTCFGVNLTTHAAQPALLYLVPAMVAGVLATGWARGEVKEVVEFKMQKEEVGSQ